MISYIIASYREYPRILFTVENIILNHARLDGKADVATDEYEIIIVTDGPVHEELITKIHSPHWKAHHVQLLNRPNDAKFRDGGIARNEGAEIARGDTFCFIDAHVLMLKESIETSLQLLEEKCEVVHLPCSWGGINPDRCYHYTLTLEKNMWGVLNPYAKSPDPYPIAAFANHVTFIKARDFKETQGWPSVAIGYGPVETCFDLSCWMLGKRIYTNTRGHVTHVYGPHQYGGTNWDFWRNVFVCAYTLGGTEWADKILRNALNREPEHLRDEFLTAYDEGVADAEPLHEWMDGHKEMSVEEMLNFFKDNDVAH